MGQERNKNRYTGRNESKHSEKSDRNANGKIRKKSESQEVSFLDVAQYLTVPGLCDCGNNYTYQGLGRYQCDFCKKVFLDEYGKVREFIDHYGTNFSIMEIAEMTGVSKKLIDDFIKDGKFMEVERQRICIVCHQPIATGLYCKRCALTQIGNDLDEQYQKNISSGLRNEDMRGMMHYGRKTEQN